MIRLSFFIAFLLILNACATITPEPERDLSLSELSAANCSRFYTEFDQFIESQDVRDAQESLVQDYPFLRVNRFLVSFKSELDSIDKLEYWFSLSADLDSSARQIEWRNLTSNSRQNLKNTFFPNRKIEQQITQCGKLLVSGLPEAEKKTIIEGVEVSDDYSTALRVLGLYPLTSLYVSSQINKHQALTRELFDKDLDSLPVKGSLVRYALNTEDSFSIPQFNTRNPLTIPELDAESLQALFYKHAPILEVDEEDDNDKVGRISLNKNGEIEFVADQPTYYLLPSYVRFNGEVLLQLNYVFWFSSRPHKSRFDIYAGKLDGLIWRVTLDKNGQPIIYDSVHDCGCYHKFYITDKVNFNQDIAKEEREPPFVAQRLSSMVENARPVIRISSVAHFVNRVYFSDAANVNRMMKRKSYSTLRSLPYADNEYRSMFLSDGLVSGTERSERWLLWPMGVPSAGAMRQWGHHAVAFVGKRYFDDADLFDKYFTVK